MNVAASVDWAKKGCKRAEPFAIAALIAFSGMALGVALGVWLSSEHAASVIERRQSSVIETTRTSFRTIQQCLSDAAEANRIAADAAQAAAGAADRAARAAQETRR